VGGQKADKADQAGKAPEAQDNADAHRQQHFEVTGQIFEGMGQQGHQRLVQTEGDAEHTAGNTGEHRAKSDESALKYFKKKFP
jgi:hypothetical protein